MGVTAFQTIVSLNTASFLGTNGLNLIAAFLVSGHAVISYYRTFDFSQDPNVETRIQMGTVLLFGEQKLPDENSSSIELVSTQSVAALGETSPSVSTHG